MDTKRLLLSAWPVLGVAVMACSLFAGGAVAKAREVAVTYQVSTKGLDLNQPAGAHELYARLQHAAEVVCTHGMRVDLEPVANKDACLEKALGDAVRSANVLLLTGAYLERHTLQQAAASGINVPALLAGREAAAARQR